MDNLTDQLTDTKSDRAALDDALDAMRAAAADGLRQACADIGGGLEWVVIGAALLLSCIRIFL